MVSKDFMEDGDFKLGLECKYIWVTERKTTVSKDGDANEHGL